MTAYIDKDLTLYSSPKSGGTTTRYWFIYKKTGKHSLLGNGYHTLDISKLGISVRDVVDINNNGFKKVDSKTIAIKRDPIERFKSCYTDKIIRENENIELDYFIDNFESVLNNHEKLHSNSKVKMGYLKYHFLPQTYHLGNDKSYFDLIIDTKDINNILKPILESTWGLELPNFHGRKQDLPKIYLTDLQKEKIKNIYKCDYQAGWF